MGVLKNSTCSEWTVWYSARVHLAVKDYISRFWINWIFRNHCAMRLTLEIRRSQIQTHVSYMYLRWLKRVSCTLYIQNISYSDMESDSPKRIGKSVTKIGFVVSGPEAIPCARMSRPMAMMGFRMTRRMMMTKHGTCWCLWHWDLDTHIMVPIHSWDCVYCWELSSHCRPGYQVPTDPKPVT